RFVGPFACFAFFASAFFASAFFLGLVARSGSGMPAFLNSDFTWSDGLAPTDNQYFARSASTRSSASFGWGLYEPSSSTQRPSRGDLDSATTMRNFGSFLAPMRRRRITTDM